MKKIVIGVLMFVGLQIDACCCFKKPKTQDNKESVVGPQYNDIHQTLKAIFENRYSGEPELEDTKLANAQGPDDFEKAIIALQNIENSNEKGNN